MKKLGLAVIGILLAVNFSLASDPTKIDFHWNYKQKAAQTLFGKKEYQAAQQAFEKLVATAPSPRAKIDCISLAAIALGHQDKYDQALQKAQTISEKPMADYTRIEIMSVCGKHAELIAAFKDTNIAQWPENIAYKGYLRRAEAYKALKDDRAAVQDFEKCAELAGADTKVQLETLNRVGAIYEVLKETDKAMEAYRKVMEICDNNSRAKGAHAAYPGAIQAGARILVSQQKNDEALALLAKYDTSRSKSYGPRVLEASGDIYAAMGKKDKALAKYEEIRKFITGLNAQKKSSYYERCIERMNKKIKDLK